MWNNIILTGMPGSGKSTIGVLLAKALGYEFLDVDLLIQAREGELLQEILDKRGMEAFLRTEAEAVCSIPQDYCRTVIAPGGSALCREEAARHLASLGPIVYLNVSVEELTRRIRNMSQRGIAMKPGQTLADVLAWRDPIYRRYADLVVDCPPGQELDETVVLVRTAIEKSGLLR